MFNLTRGSPEVLLNLTYSVGYSSVIILKLQKEYLFEEMQEDQQSMNGSMFHFILSAHQLLC